MPKTLVTGGAGFIGSHTAKALLSRSHQVVVLDDLSGGFKENLPTGAEFVQGSVTDYQLLQDLFKKHSFDYVFHLAAYAAEGLSFFIKRFNYDNNLIGTVNLINLSVLHKIKCFVFTSSIAVYGKNQVPMLESMTPEPEDPYGIAKYAAELDLKSSRMMFGLPYIVFRPHNVYGEGQNIGDPYRNVVGIFMNQIMQKKPLTIFGDGEQKRAFSHIDDVAPVIARSIELPEAYGEIFNVGADTPYTVNELTYEVGNAFGIKPDIRYLEARKEAVEAFSDHAKAKKIFQTSGAVTLKEGIGRMAAWAKKHGARKSKEFENIEVRLNLPPAWEKIAT